MTALTNGAEARLLAQPVSYELATTTPEEGIGDRITMAPLSARRLTEQVSLGHRIPFAGRRVPYPSDLTTLTELVTSGRLANLLRQARAASR